MNYYSNSKLTDIARRACLTIPVVGSDFICGHGLCDLLACYSSKGPFHVASHSVHSFSGHHCVLVVVQLLIRMRANSAMLLDTVLSVGPVWIHVIVQILVTLHPLCT